LLRWLPVIGIFVAAGVPLARHASGRHAERVAVDVAGEIRQAQERFRQASARGGFAADLASLSTPCAGRADAALAPATMVSLRAAGYEALVRPAQGATLLEPDCHGRATTSDYYATIEPHESDRRPLKAFAMRANGGVFVFFDGIAPLERDMPTGGLAQPLERLGELRIP
jgi:hypothetical protein